VGRRRRRGGRRRDDGTQALSDRPGEAVSAEEAGGEPGSAEPTPIPIAFPVRIDVRTLSLTGLFVLALFYTLYLARTFVVPLIVALLLSFLFGPLVRRLRRARIPPAVSAAVVLCTLLGMAGGALYRLSGPAASWVAQAPEALSQAETKIRRLMRPLRRVSETADHVEKITDIGAASAVKVELQQETMAQALFGGTQNLLGAVMVVSILLYFLLASGDFFLTKVIKALPRLSDKKRAVQIARETEDQISAYLVTMAVVNVAFGVVIGVAMKLLGLPNAVLWGVLAGLTNFVPYVGALAMAVTLGLAALVHFEGTAQALLVPLVFLVLNFFEGNVITPRLIGQRLSLNPVMVFTGVLFWGWLWGVMGALLAVPLLAVVKIICDHVEGLGAIGELLGS
jgi:predicted PurR-regulated permease PerM